MLIGLSIQSNELFPLVVGCSLKTRTGEIVDIPARLLLNHGIVLWGEESADARFFEPIGAKGLGNVNGWAGHIIFALYKDTNFITRLADTGWFDWNSRNLFGSSSWNDQEDEEIKYAVNNKYLHRKTEMWSSFDGKPIDIYNPFL